MSWRAKFNGRLNVKWNDVNDKMPLDDHFKIFPHGGCGVLTSVFVLIDDEEDRNDDPSIVQISYLVDHNGKGSWVWADGTPYHECHAANIKYWAEEPSYEKETVEQYGSI
jgi:hypothetical protein